MRIDIQARDFSLTNIQRSHAERRLLLTMTCCDDYIERITMRLSDINHPGGSIGKCCHLKVALKGLPDVVIEDIETDLYMAIDRASDFAGRTVLRWIGRHQSLLRQSRPPI